MIEKLSTSKNLASPNTVRAILKNSCQPAVQPTVADCRPHRRAPGQLSRSDLTVVEQVALFDVGAVHRVEQFQFDVLETFANEVIEILLHSPHRRLSHLLFGAFLQRQLFHCTTEVRHTTCERHAADLVDDASHSHVTCSLFETRYGTQMRCYRLHDRYVTYHIVEM